MLLNRRLTVRPPAAVGRRSQSARSFDRTYSPETIQCAILWLAAGAKVQCSIPPLWGCNSLSSSSILEQRSEGPVGPAMDTDAVVGTMVRTTACHSTLAVVFWTESWSRGRTVVLGSCEETLNLSRAWSGFEAVRANRPMRLGLRMGAGTGGCRRILFHASRSCMPKELQNRYSSGS